MPTTFTMPAIAALYAALLALLVVALSVRIALYRMRHRIGLGDGGDKRLFGLIRAHGNAIEYIPLGVVLLALLELCGAPTPGLHVAGGVFLLARLMHAQGVAGRPGVSVGRSGGAGLTFIVLVAMAVWLLVLAIPRLAG